MNTGCYADWHGAAKQTRQDSNKTTRTVDKRLASSSWRQAVAMVLTDVLSSIDLWTELCLLDCTEEFLSIQFATSEGNR